MPSKMIVSPAKEKIELVDDQTWIEATGTSLQGLGQWYGGSKPWVIASLWLEGIMEDRPTGSATGKLYKRMQRLFPDIELPKNPTSITAMMTDATNLPAFGRATNGKRTYEIKLLALPKMWHTKMLADIEARFLVKGEPEPVAIVEQPSVNGAEPIDQDEAQSISDAELEAIIHNNELDAPTVYDVAPPIELAIASQVAMSLLTTVVEIISAGTSEAVDARVQKLMGDIADVQHKLAMRLQENDSLRRQVREAGDTIIALRAERDGLRSRLKATEANLTAALKGDAVAAINGEIQRRLDSIMRVGPTKKGDT